MGNPKVTERSVFLEIGPLEADGGELIGRRPQDVPSEFWPCTTGRNPLKALRARCLDCCCGSATEVRKCVAIDCPSWPFRLGKNPFRATRTLSDDQREKLAQRLRGTA